MKNLVDQFGVPINEQGFVAIAAQPGDLLFGRIIKIDGDILKPGQQQTQPVATIAIVTYRPVDAATGTVLGTVAAIGKSSPFLDDDKTLDAGQKLIT